MIRELITTGPLYGKFAWVFFFARTAIADIELVLGENWFKEIDWDIITRITEWCGKGATKEKPIHVLFILDDQAAWLAGADDDKRLLDFFCNRRHQDDDRVVVSVLFSTQRYQRLIPVTLRQTLTGIIIFQTGRDDIKAILKEHLLIRSVAGTIEQMGRQWRNYPKSIVYISKYPAINLWTNFEWLWESD